MSATSLMWASVWHASGRAIAAWGEAPQWRMVQEECAELIAEINRFDRGRSDESKLADEIADVIIVLAGAIRMVGPERVTLAVEAKLARLNGRLDREQGEQS